MSPQEAIKFAESWTRDMRNDPDSEQLAFFHAMKGLLGHIETQRKDIESLTVACQLLFRENKRLRDALDKD